MKEIKFEWINGKDYNERILKFLIEVDSDISPRVSSRVDLNLYSCKLAQYAMNLFVMYNEMDIAACSVYCNRQEAYISSIAVKKEHRKQGIGNEMLEVIKKYVFSRGCTTIKLEVYKNNDKAIKYYEKNGFEIQISNGEMLEMLCKL